MTDSEETFADVVERLMDEYDIPENERLNELARANAHLRD